MLNLITYTFWPAQPWTKGNFTSASRLKSFIKKYCNYNKGQTPEFAEVRPHRCRHVRWPEVKPLMAACGALVFSGGQEVVRRWS